MGYIKHHAIIVSSWNPDKLKEAHTKAVSVFGQQVTSISNAAVNIADTFLIGPDGSSEYWEESENGDQRRFEFKCWLQGQCYEDGSIMISWVELSYNDERGEPKILNHS